MKSNSQYNSAYYCGHVLGNREHSVVTASCDDVNPEAVAQPAVCW